MWIPKISKTRGSVYWYNTKTKVTSWTLTNEEETLAKQFVAIIVPYRNQPQQNRAEHLTTLLRRLPEILESVSSVRFKIYVIEQSQDGRKFNRGKLLNIGFQLAQREPYPPSHIIFHDVDLIPNEETARLYFEIPRDQEPVCIAKAWGRYSSNPRYFGGIVSISCDDFRVLNGFPNNFWGWGGEDDELRLRMDYCNFRARGPPEENIFAIEDLERFSIEEKMNVLRTHTEWKCLVKRELLNESRETWRHNGINNNPYRVLETMPVNDYAERVTVELSLNNHWSDSSCGFDNRTWGFI